MSLVSERHRRATCFGETLFPCYLHVTLGSSDARRSSLVIRTLSHGAAYTRHLIRGNHLPSDMKWSRPGAPPVLLAHGFLGTRGTMQPLARRFGDDGRATFSYHHGTLNLRSLLMSAQQLVDHFARLEKSLGVSQFDVVGFSMGGLIALHAVKFLQAHRWVRRLALLGSPTDGTWAGLLGVATVGWISPSVWQCLPTSEFIADLRAAPLPPGMRVRQIHASHDALCPLPRPLPGVDPQRDFIVLPGGHSSLVVAHGFYDALKDFFDEPEAASADATVAAE